MSTTIVVNLRAHQWDKPVITIDEVCALAGFSPDNSLVDLVAYDEEVNTEFIQPWSGGFEGSPIHLLQKYEYEFIVEARDADKRRDAYSKGHPFIT